MTTFSYDMIGPRHVIEWRDATSYGYPAVFGLWREQPDKSFKLVEAYTFGTEMPKPQPFLVTNVTAFEAATGVRVRR